MARQSRPHTQRHFNVVASKKLNSQFQVAEPLRNISVYYHPAAIFFNELLPMQNKILHYIMHAALLANPIGRPCQREGN